MALLRQASGLGIALTASGEWLDWRAAAPPPPAFLDELRRHKGELLALLSGARCRHCGEPVEYRRPGALTFADGTAAHGHCYEAASSHPRRHGPRI